MTLMKSLQQGLLCILLLAGPAAELHAQSEPLSAGDRLMLEDIFLPNPPADKYLRAADERAGACSIYEGRPETCRSHHSSDAALCAANEADASVNVTKAYVPALRARMFAVMMGIDEAMEACGYDERCYDFGSALHEALTNSRCLTRWLRRSPAFPDNCLAGG